MFGTRMGADEIGGAGLQQRDVLTQRGPEAPADAIAGHGVTHDPSHRERDARRFGRGPDHGGSHLEIPGAAASAARERVK
jgi:hypothetical protein